MRFTPRIAAWRNRATGQTHTDVIAAAVDAPEIDSEPASPILPTNGADKEANRLQRLSSGWISRNAPAPPTADLRADDPAPEPPEMPLAVGDSLPLPSLDGFTAADFATHQLPAEDAHVAPQQPAVAPAAVEDAKTQQVESSGATSPARSISAAASIVGLAFVVSRFLGLFRDQIIAAQFGNRLNDLDAYIAAFRIPDVLFTLVIGGAVGSAFIPVFSSMMERQETAKAWRLAATLINASVIILAALALLMAVLAPAVVATVIAPGYDQAKQALTVDLTRIMLLSPLLLGLGGWAQGILNARQHFALPALAPIAYNVCIIIGALFLTPIYGVHGIAYGVVLGGLMHFLVQLPGVVRVGMQYSPLHLDVRDEGVAQVSKLMLPRIGGQAALQINIIVATWILSFLSDGRQTAFNYAYLLMMLPYGIFAMSMATVIFPTMSSQIGRGDLAGMRATLTGGLRVLFFLIAPSAVLLGFLRTEIVGVLFEFGNFRADARDLVAVALGAFAWGLLAYAMVEVLTRGFFALHDTRTPVLVSVGTVVANILLSGFLVFGLKLDHTALALSLSITTTLEMVLLFYFLRRKTGELFDARTLRSVGTTLVATAALATVLQVVTPFFSTYIWSAPDDTMGNKIVQILVLCLSAGCGMVAFLAVARLLRAEELSLALSMVLRRRRR